MADKVAGKRADNDRDAGATKSDDELKDKSQDEIDAVAAAAIVQGANPFVGLTRGQIVSATLRWGLALGRKPTVLVSAVLRWAAEETRVVAGVSSARPDEDDRRFADSAWQNPLWRRIAQAYVVSRSTALGSVDDLGLDRKSADRARLALSQVTEAAAPTNVLLGNPAALKKAWATKGKSLFDGGRHLIGDLRHNAGMPSQVDTTPFRVGETIATTDGAVVLRTPLFELIQYAPTTSSVSRLPTVIIPPQINRYYFLDLAPERSFVEYTVSRGIQTFLISWRNPRPEHRDWGLDDYASACREAMQAAAHIAGTEQVNALGFCAGGMTLSALLSHLTSTGDDLVNAASLAVTLIDTEVESTLNTFVSQRTVSSAIARSRRKGVLDGKSLSRTFAWMRPNDLVWNYWVANYLLGKDPPAFDVLAWNADATNLSATLHAEFLHLWLDNALTKPGTLDVLGTPVDLGAVKNDLYVIGALTDHLVPWKSAYAAVNAFGGDTSFVLSNSGHIQALVNPPGNPKASFSHATDTPLDADEWLEQSTKSKGSWWEDWAAWMLERSGDTHPAPDKLGDDEHKVVEMAPGRYVRE